MDQITAPKAAIVDLLHLPRPGVLQLDPAHSIGDLHVRHALWGAQRITLIPLRGLLQTSLEGALAVELSLRTAHAPDRRKPGPAGVGTGPETIRFTSTNGVRRVDANVYELAGDLAMGSVTGALTLRIRDLGWMAANGRGRRHLLALSASLPREFWRWSVTARQTGWMLEHEAKLFLHTEWVPASGVKPAA